MRKYLFYLVVLSVLVLGLASCAIDKPKRVKIKKPSSENTTGGRPRSLVDATIDCIYSDGSLSFSFMEDMGEVKITVTNLSSGVVSADNFDSFKGSAVLVTSSLVGEYRIDIVTQNGETYYGVFDL